MSQPPRELFAESPSTAVLEVRVHQDEHGRIWSVHQFRSGEDEKKTQQWSGGGARQLAFAFLTEALRREAFASILVELTKDGEYLKNYKDADEATKGRMENQLGLTIQAVLSNSSLKMGGGIAKEILQMVSGQV